jgi:hypothetical protein
LVLVASLADDCAPVKGPATRATLPPRSIGAVNAGDPRRASDLVFEWLAVHRDELMADWKLARERKPLKKIDPLE